MTSLSDLTTLADVAALAATLPEADAAAREAADARQMSLTKPPRALGRLEDLAVFMAGWQKTHRPSITQAQALVFAGNHGICARGVNPFPQEVTAQMVANFRSGGAAINQLCRASGAELDVVELDLDTPTADFTAGPAMTEAEVLEAMKAGAGAVPATTSVLVLGEMGIGNSTVAAALAAAAFGGDAADWVGRGTGSDAEGKALLANPRPPLVWLEFQDCQYPVVSPAKAYPLDFRFWRHIFRKGWPCEWGIISRKILNLTRNDRRFKAWGMEHRAWGEVIKVSAVCYLLIYYSSPLKYPLGTATIPLDVTLKFFRSSLGL